MARPQPRAVLIDAMAYLFRAHYAMRPISAPDGTPVAALFGLGMTLQRLLKDRRPTHAAAVFDAGAQTFRNDLYPDYKANRGEPPEEMVPQFPLAPQLTRAMGLATYLQPGFEADDLLATLTARLHADGFEVTLVSGDKDLSQLVGPGVELYDLAKDTTFDEEAVLARFGVHPRQLVDYLGLTGDSVDNIPGVPGVGPVAATALLGEFEDLDSIYADLDRVRDLSIRGARSLATRLETHRQLAFLSRELATVEREVPLEFEAAELSYEGADPREIDDFAESWGLRRVAAQCPRRPVH
jgi:DNA polymerase-1